MSKSDDKSDKQQKGQDAKVMKAKTTGGREITMVQTGENSRQINGDNHGGISQSFGS